MPRELRYTLPMSAQPHFSRLQARAAGRDWTLLRPADLDSLWEGMTQDEFAWDERIPYWVELWPASLALADWLLKQRGAINGRLCLDLGCGLGLSALTASSLGARVLAMDYVKDALAFARMNAAANGTPQPWWIAADWRAPAFKAQSFAFIWGGDVMYERRFAGPVLDCLEYALAPGGKVWLAEPGREVYGAFLNELTRRGWAALKVWSGMVAPARRGEPPPPDAPEAPGKVSAVLWELRHE